MAVKRFLLFTAPKQGDRKQFVASFATRDEGVEMGEKLRGNLPMRWQIVDSNDSKVVAEHAGSEVVAEQAGSEEQPAAT